jgi:hypothetical protein
MPAAGQAAVRLRLDVTDGEAGRLLRAAGARRFGHNWAVAQIKANADQWAAEATCGIAKAERVRPLTYFTLAKMWTAAKPAVAPWAASTQRGRSCTASEPPPKRTRRSCGVPGGSRNRPPALSRDPPQSSGSSPSAGRETDHGGTASVGNTCSTRRRSSRCPAFVRHAAENEDELEATQRFDPGFRQPRPLPAVPKDPAGRAEGPRRALILRVRTAAGSRTSLPPWRPRRPASCRSP